jgi:hypothetical protein
MRLRQPGRGTIKEKDVLVDPATQTSPHPVLLSWQERSAGTPTDYVVDVRRQDGGPVITSETFTLLPPLVSNLSATPSPFYPLVQDGYKDDTTIGFRLSADSVDTVVHVYAEDPFGRCCGAEIRTVDLGSLASGSRAWVWDGMEDDFSEAPKGTYFAKVEATDTDAVSMTSKPLKIEIAKGQIRVMGTKEKHGSAYARVANEQQTAIGGDCGVTRDSTTHSAFILCANAVVSVYWNWGLKQGEKIEKVSFVIDGGFYGCHKTTGHSGNSSFLRLKSGPTSTCTVTTARITYSYPVQA